MPKKPKTRKQGEPVEAKAEKLMDERQPVDEYIDKVTQKIIDLESDLFKLSGYTQHIQSPLVASSFETNLEALLKMIKHVKKGTRFVVKEE
ncbi:MAG: hypothetical protein R6U40_13120 [Desulfobacterales bacterium]